MVLSSNRFALILNLSEMEIFGRILDDCCVFPREESCGLMTLSWVDCWKVLGMRYRGPEAFIPAVKALLHDCCEQKCCLKMEEI